MEDPKLQNIVFTGGFLAFLKKRGGIYGCQPCGHLSGFLFTCPACI